MSVLWFYAQRHDKLENLTSIHTTSLYYNYVNRLKTVTIDTISNVSFFRSLEDNLAMRWSKFSHRNISISL